MAVYYVDPYLTNKLSELFWVSGTSYVVGDKRAGKTGGAFVNMCFTCLSDHTAGSTDEPGVGANWMTYWSVSLGTPADVTTWSVSQSYSVGNIRYGPSGYVQRAYVCIQAHTSTNGTDKPETGATWTSYWTLICDGSASKPYTSLGYASAVASGGDEVRVAKTPAPTLVAASATWTDGSTITVSGDVTGGVDDRNKIAQYDLIMQESDGSGIGWEVESVSYSAGTGLTTITVYGNWAGTTGTYALYKCDYAVRYPGSGATIFAVQTASSSFTSRVSISFGWNLSGTPAQDGHTWFGQRNTTMTNRYGTWLYQNGGIYHVDYDLTRAGFFRGSYGLRVLGTYTYLMTCNVTSGRFIGTDSAALSFSTVVWARVTGTIMSSSESTNYKVYAGAASETTLTSLQFLAVYYGSDFAGGAGRVKVVSPVFKRVANYCMRTYEAQGFPGSGVRMTDPTFYQCAYGVLVVRGTNNLAIYRPVYSTVVGALVSNGASSHDLGPCVTITESGGVTGYWAYGVGEKNTAQARSGSCLKLTPNHATYYMVSHGLFRTWVTAGADRVISIYAYCSGATYATNDVMLAVIGEDGTELVADTNLALTGSYARYTLTIPSASLTFDQLAELRFKVRRTNSGLLVFFDDFMDGETGIIGGGMSNWADGIPAMAGPVPASSGGGGLLIHPGMSGGLNG